MANGDGRAGAHAQPARKNQRGNARNSGDAANDDANDRSHLHLALAAEGRVALSEIARVAVTPKAELLQPAARIDAHAGGLEHSGTVELLASNLPRSGHWKFLWVLLVWGPSDEEKKGFFFVFYFADAFLPDVEYRTLVCAWVRAFVGCFFSKLRICGRKNDWWH